MRFPKKKIRSSRNALLQEQFIQAYENYADAIFRHCYFRVYNRDLARDLVQETFAKTWEYVTGGTEVKNLRAFLYRVANNLIIDYARKKKALSLNVLQENGFDPKHEEKGSLFAMLDAKTVIIRLEELDKKYSEVILMRYVD